MDIESGKGLADLIQPTFLNKKLKSLDIMHDKLKMFSPEAADSFMKPSELVQKTLSGDFNSIINKYEKSKKFIENPTTKGGHQFGVDKDASFNFYKKLFGSGDEGDDVGEWEKKQRDKSAQSRKKVLQALGDSYGVDPENIEAVGSKVTEIFENNQEMSPFELFGSAFKFNDMWKQLSSKDPKERKKIADKLKEVRDLDLDKKFGKFFGINVDDEEGYKNRMADRKYRREQKDKSQK